MPFRFPNRRDDPTTGNADEDHRYNTADMPGEPMFHRHKVGKRRMVDDLKKTSLIRLVPELPPPDEDLYIISNGAGAERQHGINPDAFDFGGFVPYIVAKIGGPVDAFISTWAMNRNHAEMFVRMIRDGEINRLSFLTDPYFMQRTMSVAAYFVEQLKELGSQHRFLSFKNHTKIIAVTNGERYCTVTGSANLSSQPRCEQYVLSTSPDVYWFFVNQFFEEMMKRG